MVVAVTEWEEKPAQRLMLTPSEGFQHKTESGSSLRAKLAASALLGDPAAPGTVPGTGAGAEMRKEDGAPCLSLLASSRRSDSSYCSQGHVGCCRRGRNGWCWQRNLEFFLLHKGRGCWEHKGGGRVTAFLPQLSTREGQSRQQ